MAKRVVAALLALLLLPSVGSAQGSPRRTLEDFLSEATTIGREAADPQMAWSEVHDLAAGLFDGRAAARRTLGAEWEERSGAERAELATLLGAVLAHAYLELARGRLPRDRPPVMRVLGEEIARDGATVRTSVRARDGTDVRLDYLMGRAGGRWRVHDVVMDGVSMVENYRAQFVRVVRTSSDADALARLRRLAGVTRIDGRAVVRATP